MSFLLLPLIAFTLVAWFMSMVAGAYVIDADTPQRRRAMWPYVLLSLAVQLLVMVAAVNVRYFGQ